MSAAQDGGGGNRGDISAWPGAARRAAMRMAAAMARRAWRTWRSLRGITRAHILEWLHRQGVIEAQARSGFFIAPAAMMAGILLVFGLGLRPDLAVVTILAVSFLMPAILMRHSGLLRIILIVAALASAGAALSVAELARVTTTIFSGEATTRIDGRVLWRDTDERGRSRYLVAIDRTERPTLSRPPERARILLSSRHETLALGSRYVGLVRLRPPSGPALPGSYDFAFGSHFDGLGAYGFGLGPPEPPIAGTPSTATSPGEWLVGLRLWMGERIRATVGGAEGAVAAALIMGDRAGIPDEIDAWLRVAGLSHVLSISGLHMALVAGFAMVTVRAVLAAIPWCALVWPIKKIAAVAALFVATFYLLVSGSNVATDRSYIMLSIMLLAVLFDRPALTLRNVAIAAMIVLALSPHALVTASFQMSFAATAAMIGAYSAYAARDEGSQRGTLRGPVLAILVFLAGLGITSIIAGLATAPYSAFHFQRIQPFGLIANMVALPLFSFWIMPLALISVVLMPFGLDGIFLQLMGYGLGLVFEIARLIHDSLGDAPTGVLTREGLLVLSLALIVGAFLSSRLRWFAVPLAALGLALSPSRAAPPELLVFEDGREIALIDQTGTLTPLRERPNDFVFSQWQRAFPGSSPRTEKGTAEPPGFDCRVIQPEAPLLDTSISEGADNRRDGGTAERSSPSGEKVAAGTPSSRPTPSASTQTSGRPPRTMRFCTSVTRGGLKVAWTDDYRETGRACDEADIAIVARAIRLTECRSGSVLVTLRTLRRSGSLAVSRDVSDDKPAVTSAIGNLVDEWNSHRLAAWPESFRPAGEGNRPTPSAASSPTAGKNGEEAD